MDPVSMLSMTYGTSLLPRSGASSANAIGIPLVRHAWIQEKTPALSKAIEVLPGIMDPPNAREKAACKLLRRSLGSLREAVDLDKLGSAPLLDELAQLLAGFERVRKRTPEKLQDKSATVEQPAQLLSLPPPQAEPAAEPGAEPGAEPSAEPGAEPGMESEETPLLRHDQNFEAAETFQGPRPGFVFKRGDLGLGYYHDEAPAVENEAESSKQAPIPESSELLVSLLECIPAFRLDIPHTVLSQLVHLSEYPSFFTSGIQEKQFEVSLEALVGQIITGWSAEPATHCKDFSVVGLGCSIDITHDDCAVVWAILA